MLKSADRKGGFPHSEITGSKGARASPVLIAACHVLHRLSTPRHPSEALMRLIVLSKTHAWGRCARPYEEALRAHTCALVLSLPDNDVFSGSVLKGWGARTDPSFTMSTSRAQGLAGMVVLSSTARWWSQTGSNRRPHACKARALPTELWPRRVSSFPIAPG